MLSIWQLIAIAAVIFYVGMFLFSLALGAAAKQGDAQPAKVREKP